MHLPLYGSLVFGIAEFLLLVFKRAEKSSGLTASKTRDSNSLNVLWLVISLSLTAGFFLAAGTFGIAGRFMYSRPVFIIACLLFLAGMLIRWVAIVQLGKFFTVDVAINSQHALKQNGLYKWVRHPSYLGLLLIFCGLGLGLFNFLSFIIVVVPVTMALLYRIGIEEGALKEAFGSTYKEYMKRTKRLIPFVY